MQEVRPGVSEVPSTIQVSVPALRIEEPLIACIAGLGTRASPPHYLSPELLPYSLFGGGAYIPLQQYNGSNQYSSSETD